MEEEGGGGRREVRRTRARWRGGTGVRRCC